MEYVIDFKNHYYLREELVDFCRKNKLQTSGSKSELTERIVHYLNTGEKLGADKKYRKANIIDAITLNNTIEHDFVCSEKHRTFFKEHIGKSFSFNVKFQKWLKSNSGKTYQEAINAYYQIIDDKKETIIDKQFEYNTYIREFFKENKDMTLNQAIKCWKYKKNLPGHHGYETSDLNILELMSNIDKIHTTKLGAERIKRNLCLNVEDVVGWCKQKVQDENSFITRKGKNWYVSIDGCEITINANSYTIITAHRNKNNEN